MSDLPKNREELEECIKNYIVNNLKLDVDKHYADGYDDSDYVKISILIDDETIASEFINLPSA